MPRPAPYTTRDVAEFLGRSPDCVLRSLEHLHLLRGMPLPLTGRPYRWDRAAFDLWRAGCLLPVPANDAHPTPAEAEDWQRELAAEYGAA